MRIKTLVIFGLVLWAWSGVPVFAQNYSGSHRFIEKDDISIFVEDLVEDDRACGITKTGLDAAVRLPLSRNGFRVKSAENKPPLLRIAVIGLEKPDACTVYLELTFTRTLLLPSSMPIFGNVWSKNMLLWWDPKVGIHREVYDTLEDFTKEWIAQWLVDNPQ
jgi:hypothetical protein